MPYKYPLSKGWNVPKQKYKVSNWAEYNNYLKQRGDIEFWISEDVIEYWYEEDALNTGHGAAHVYSDYVITLCAEIRKVFKLPLRQSEGFINAVFRMKGVSVACPDFSTQSRRCSSLDIKVPRYRDKDKRSTKATDDLAAIAIDATGLKQYGRDEWHQEKHNVSARRTWKKLHIAVDDSHIIQAAIVTTPEVIDEKAIPDLLQQITVPVEQYSADKAYDSANVYEVLSVHSPGADIAIPPDANAVIDKANHPIRNKHVQEIEKHGMMEWQRLHGYGKRNDSELAFRRYKMIFGNTMQAREPSRQKTEGMIACGVLNKMTRIGMPKSYRVA